MTRTLLGVLAGLLLAGCEAIIALYDVPRPGAQGDVCADGGCVPTTCVEVSCDGGTCFDHAVKDGTPCPDAGRCCSGRCSGLDEQQNCGVCGVACPSGSACLETGTGGHACDCALNYRDSFCQGLYGVNTTCYPPPPATPLCNCFCPDGDVCNTCPNGTTCTEVEGVNYCHY